MSNFEHAKYDADGVRIDDPTFNTQALRNDTSLVNGITFPAANTVAINTNSVERFRVGNEGQTTILAASSSPALKVTQTGSGNAFVVEDSASPDSTIFGVNPGGQVFIGHTSQPFFVSGVVPQVSSVGTSNTTGQFATVNYSADASPTWLHLGKSRGAIGAQGLVVSGDNIGNIEFSASDGTIFTSAARIAAFVDGTPGTNDMPGRLVFYTTADGANSPTEALRIDSTQSIINNSVGSGTNAYGFRVTSAKIGGTNNYAFSGEIAAGANRYNCRMSGTAANFFAGDMQLGKTVTAGGTTGAQTIDKTIGSVNFAAAATSLVVTNNLVTTSSIILATVGTNDATMKSVAVVAAAGSFTLHANAAATAETRVNFCVFN